MVKMVWRVLSASGCVKARDRGAKGTQTLRWQGCALAECGARGVRSCWQQWARERIRIAGTSQHFDAQEFIEAARVPAAIGVSEEGS